MHYTKHTGREMSVDHCQIAPDISLLTSDISLLKSERKGSARGQRHAHPHTRTRSRRRRPAAAK